jgi:translocation and assembly module TamB
MSFRRRALYTAAILAGLSVVAVAIAWVQRRPIAAAVLDDYFARNHIEARYDIVAVGTKHQRIENIIIGDPAHPELVAKWAEIDIVPRFFGVEIKAVRANDVWIKGDYSNGKLSLGSLDRLLPEPSNAPFRWPDIDVSLTRARMLLWVGGGALGIRLDGKGNPAHSFKGSLALVAPYLGSEGIGRCTLRDTKLVGALTLNGGRAQFRGPLRVNHLGCRDQQDAFGLETYLDVGIDQNFDVASGLVKFASRSVAVSENRAEDVRGNLDFTYKRAAGSFGGIVDLKARSLAGAGAFGENLVARGDFLNTGQETKGTLRSQFARLAFSHFRGAGATITSGFSILNAPNAPLDIEATGVIKAQGLVPDATVLAKMKAVGRTGIGTPIEPLAKALASDVGRLDQGSTVDARYAYSLERNQHRLALSDIRGASVSGLQVRFSGNSPVVVSSPGTLALAGTALIAGGGLPRTVIVFDPVQKSIAGTATVAPYSKDGARLAFSPFRFTYGPSGFGLDGRATVDGPLAGGWVAGVGVPLTVRGGAVQLSGCMPISYQIIRLAGFVLSPGRIDTCVDGGSARFKRLAVKGRYAGQPVSLRAGDASMGLSGGGFRGADLVIDYGATKARARRASGHFKNGIGDFQATEFQVTQGSVRSTSPWLKATVRGGTADFKTGAVRFTAGSGTNQSDFTASGVTGRYVNSSATGTYADGQGQIANVPLKLSDARGRWRFSQNTLALWGDLRVTDTAPERRFLPVQSNGFSLKLANGTITAQGAVREEQTGALLANVRITHDLGQGVGQADLDVPQIVFGPNLQPEQITPITEGVIALVHGSVSGTGRINWAPRGVTSTGRFRTDGLDLGAAFGPVTGLKGEISLSNLLGLETAPGQRVTIGSINPGILVSDGDVRYQLLPGLKVAVEGGRWPLAGGTLILEPTIIDLSESAERRMTFRVEGLDAARFIAMMEFENISATGIFDGVLPMVFDKDGGRIERGSLTVREGGGTLSYIGEISRENLGTYGSIAFDALKSMKYQKLTIDLDGAIDGEMVTKIKFNGVNQLPVTPGRAALPLPIKVQGLSGIPFIFNISITAPFRRLIWMSRSFEDPSQIIEDALKKERRRRKEQNGKTEADKFVQPPESESKP